MGRAPRWTWLAALAAVVLAVAVHGGHPAPGDAAVAGVLVHAPARLVWAVAVASAEPALAALAVLLAWALRRSFRPLPFLGLMAGVVVLERVLKVLVHRPRPGGGEDGWGFPSGHAMMTMTLAVLVLGSAWPHLHRRARAALALMAAAGVALIGIDRIALGVHWPSDVLGAWLIGLVYGTWTLPWVSAVQPAGERGEADAARDVSAPV